MIARFLMVVFAGVLTVIPALAGFTNEVFIQKRIYQPFFREIGEEDLSVGPLWVDRVPVTNAQFEKFVRQNPQWSKGAAPEIVASESYLKHWSKGRVPKKIADHPVVNVSWFAARQYCESQGKRLLTVAEWEAISDAQNPKNLALILEWYGQRNSIQTVKHAAANTFGLKGMHGLIWEWVEDYSSVIIGGDSRDSNETSASMFCGSGAMKAKDPNQYATFMRFAYRSSLKANYTGAILGFRCARDLVKE